MALIDALGEPIPESWRYLGDEDLQLRAGTIAPFVVVAAAASVGHLPRPIGALVSSDISAERVQPYLGALDIVVVQFPKVRDGRGFTIARALREQYGFEGDIRAIGHFLPDQFTALTTCGFSSIATPSARVP